MLGMPWQDRLWVFKTLCPDCALQLSVLFHGLSMFFRVVSNCFCQSEPDFVRAMSWQWVSSQYHRHIRPKGRNWLSCTDSFDRTRRFHSGKCICANGEGEKQGIKVVPTASEISSPDGENSSWAERMQL